MNALPDYASYALAQYLANQHEGEKMQERLDRQVEVELRSRETWEQGIAEAAYEKPGYDNPIITALMAEDFAEAGHLIHKHIIERYAVEQAEFAILKQDEDAANDFLVD